MDTKQDQVVENVDLVELSAEDLDLVGGGSINGRRTNRAG
jgi:hypothetical protein